MLILVGPSASGKTEIANILINKYNMKRMVTYTTRPIRIGEVEGISYNFVSKNEFLKLKENDEFVETVVYNDNYYGTRKKDVSFEKIVILEPNGLESFYEKMPSSITSFYLDSKEEERRKRMINRKDKLEDIEKRIENDRISFANIKKIDYVVKNDDIQLSLLAERIYKIYQEVNKK